MPSLNNLRTKGGVIVTIVIFIALLAFIIGDVFIGGSSIFNARKTRVGRVNGSNIDYTEFYSESEYIGGVYKMMWGRDAVGSQEQEFIYNSTWEQMLMKYSYLPSFKNMGLTVSDAEQLDMVDGVYLSPVIVQNFTNPNTGIFDPSLLRNFMMSAGEDDYAYAIWNFLKGQMVDNRMMTKYMALVSNGFNVTSFEVQNAVKTSGQVYGARVVSKSYFSVPDSVVTVSDKEIRDYYSKHKEMFKQDISRDVEYVVFDVMPSQEDYLAAEEEMNKIAADFAASTAPMQYATINSQERPDQRYYSESQLSTHLAAIAFGRDAGSLYGPVLNNDTYTLSRVADEKMMPDSIGARHILLEPGQTELADSLMGVIRRGADFAALAREFSQDPSAAYNGGDLGNFAPEEMVAEFSDAVLAANTGSVVTAESQFGLHIIQVTHKARPVRKVQVATITYRVDPSETTMKNIYSRASSFVSAAGGTADGFKQAVTDEALSKRSIRIRNTDRTLSGLENSKELIRWAYNNKKGAVSAIMEIDGDYLVAALTDVKDDEYSPVQQVSGQIRETLLTDAKAKHITDMISGTTIDAIASSLDSEVKEVADIEYNGFFIPEVGAEPAMLGALSASTAGKISNPVKGYSGVYVFELTGITNDPAVTAEGEKARLQANSELYIEERTSQALYEESDVTDMRVKFF